MHLSDKVTTIPGVGSIFSVKLEKLGINTLLDLLYFLPFRYEDRSRVTPIKNIRVGEQVTLVGNLTPVKNITSKNGKRLQVATLTDASGKLNILWFNQMYLSRMFFKETQVTLYGKVEFYSGKPALFSPQYSPGIDTGILPVYHETSGLSSKWLRGKIANLINQITEAILPYHLNWKQTLMDIHFPKDLSLVEPARKKLAFDELVILQLQSLRRKQLWDQSHTSPKLEIKNSELELFSKDLPFTLTASQQTALAEIRTDLAKPISMNRLLLGDVGSGKTVVAAAAAFVAVKNGYQVAILVPTQILAQQHFQTLSDLFRLFNISVVLITSKLKNNNSEFEIIVGTQSLLAKKMEFKNLGLVVIDEQHRFGVEQRQILINKGCSPHILTMTATPIPRTVALTKYSDLDLSELLEKPKGRQTIKTWVVPEEKRLAAIDWIKKQSGQIFWICPLIEESETLAAIKSVKVEYQNLQKTFSDLKLGLLHGKMKTKEKDEVIEKLRNKDIDMLVATPVVEVGVDIPGATIMVIEAAERFGLASLHQLRGRVGRNDQPSFCLLFANTGIERLKNLEKIDSGMELAEIDFRLRGPGSISGTTQHGQSDFKIANFSDLSRLPEAKTAAGNILSQLANWPTLRILTSPVKIEARN